MSIEVTVFVPFTYEREVGEILIEGTAEIYGGADDFDVVKLKVGKDEGFLLPDRGMWLDIRNELIHAQYVYDTVREAVSMEHDAR